MNHNSSSAYNLARFEQQAARPEIKVAEQKKSAKRTLSFFFTPRTLGAFAVIVTMMSLMVFNHVHLNELAGSINAVKREITQMESEYIVMRSQMESMASMELVTQRAREELGMHRLDQYQTRYVNLYGQDRIVLSDRPQQTQQPSSVRLSVRGVIGRLLEYIS